MLSRFIFIIIDVISFLSNLTSLSHHCIIDSICLLHLDFNFGVMVLSGSLHIVLSRSITSTNLFITKRSVIWRKVVKKIEGRERGRDIFISINDCLNSFSISYNIKFTQDTRVFWYSLNIPNLQLQWNRLHLQHEAQIISYRQF